VGGVRAGGEQSEAQGDGGAFAGGGFAKEFVAHARFGLLPGLGDTGGWPGRMMAVVMKRNWALARWDLDKLCCHIFGLSKKWAVFECFLKIWIKIVFFSFLVR